MRQKVKHDMTISWDRHLKNGNVWGVEVYVVAPTSELAMYIVSTMYPDYESISVDDEPTRTAP